MAGATLDVTLNPIIDVTNWNKIMETLKTSLGALGTTLKPIDASQAFVGIVSSATKAVDDTKAKFNDLPKSTNDTGTKAGNNFKNSFVSSISGLGNSLNGALAPVLSVFGGNVLTKGFSSVVGSFGDWIEKGKAVMENSNQMRMAFSLQGKSNEELNKSITDTNKVAGALANTYAMTVGEVREYSKAAAVLGGASGKSNETLTQLGIAVSKATNGMVDGTMAIRLFSKGVADPESQFALGRLTKQFPALGAAMKDLKDPAEATTAAMKFFAPAMSELEKQSNGPIGSFTKLQNNLNAVKTAFGSVIIEAIAPFAQSFSQTIVPALQSFTGFIKGIAGFISPLAPLFTIVGTALGGLVVSLLALKGVSYLGTLTQQGMQFGLTILQKVVPSLVAQNAAQTALVLNTEALTLANVKSKVASLADVAIKSVQAGATWLLTTAQTALNAAFLANPIGLVVLALAGLTAALVIAYNNSESFRNLMNNVWTVMKTAFTYVWEIIKNVGSAIATFGSLIWNVAIVPFKIWWSVMSAIGNTILDLLGLNGKATDSFSTMQKILNWLADAFHYVMLGIEAFKAVIEGVIAYIGSMVDSVGTGIKQLFSLDFGGLWDTITGAGDKAANAFSEKFNEKMRAANFDEAKSALTENLSSGLDIQAKINVETNNKQLVTEYEETSKKISELLSIKSTQGLSKEQQADLDALQKKASETGAKIAQIAPEAVNSFKGITDANGKITDSYDINIDKAKEFANANNFSGVFEEQKNRVSKNLTDMAQTYGSQVQQMETYRQQLQQPIENEEDYAKLKDKFAETKKAAEAMKNELIDAFIQSGTNGLVTEEAINKVAQSLGKTNQQAKEMLLEKELKGAAEAGALTNEKMEILAKKYNVSKEEVSRIFNKQTEITRETEKTKQAAMGWGDMLGEVSKKQKEAKEAVLQARLQLNRGQITEAEYNQKVAESNAKIASSNQDVLDINKAQKDVKQSNVVLGALEIETEKEKNKQSKETAKNAKDAYDRAKEKYDLELKTLQAQNNAKKLAEDKFNFDNDIILTAQAQRQQTLRYNELKKQEIELSAKDTASLLEQANSIKDKAKKEQEITKLKEEQVKISESLQQLDTDNSKIKSEIRVDTKKAKEELQGAIKGLQSELNKQDLQLGIKTTLEISNIDLTTAKKDLETAQNELIDLQLQMPKAMLSYDTVAINELTKKITEAQSKVNKAREDVNTKTADNEYNLAIANLNKITNYKDRQQQKELLDLDKKYKEDLLKAQGNEYQKSELTNKFLADKYALEQKYIEETQTIFQKSLNPSALLADWKSAFDGVSFFSDTNTDNTAIADITKQQDDLKNSYKDGSVAYASYIDQMNDLDKKRTEEVKKQSSAQSRILRAFSESIAKYTQIQIIKYEEERNKYVSEQQKRYDAKAKLESDLASIDDKNSAKAIALKSQIAQTENDINSARIDADTNLYNQMGFNLMNYVAQGKSAFKSLVLSSLDLLYGKFLMALPDIFIQSIAWLGPIAGPIVAGGLTATLTGLYSAAKQGVSKLKFWQGGLIPGGQQDITVNEIGQEFVVNHKALMKGNNLKDLIAINRDNISIEEYAKRQYSTYKNEQNAYNNYLDNKILEQGFAELKQEIRNVAVQTRRNVGLEVKLDTDKMIEATILKHNQKVGRF